MHKLHDYYGYGGLLPFIGLGIAASIHNPIYINAFISYAALIYSFIGGIYWHTTLTDQTVRERGKDEINILNQHVSGQSSDKPSTEHLNIGNLNISNINISNLHISNIKIGKREGILTVSILMMLWAWVWLLTFPLIPLEIIALSFLLLPVLEHALLRPVFEKNFKRMRAILSIAVATITLAVSVFH